MHRNYKHRRRRVDGDCQGEFDMAIISKELAEKHLILWLKAEAACAAGQSYQIEQMTLTRASLKQIREEIEFWSGKVAEAEAAEKGQGRNRIYHFQPHDM